MFKILKILSKNDCHSLPASISSLKMFTYLFHFPHFAFPFLHSWDDLIIAKRILWNILTVSPLVITQQTFVLMKTS